MSLKWQLLLYTVNGVIDVCMHYIIGERMQGEVREKKN